MRALVQRVTEATVLVGDEVVGQIGRGLAVLLGIGPNDDKPKAQLLANKIANLRIFADDGGKVNLSALDVHAEFLVVSQFTLYADTSKGRRPSFTEAAPPALAEPLLEVFVEALRVYGFRVATGRFGASMLVKIFNDGPVTMWLEV